MFGGQTTLTNVTDSQLEAVLDVKRANEGHFQVTAINLASQPPFPVPPVAYYGPDSPWGMARGIGQWFGPGSQFGMFPPGMQSPALAPPAGQPKSLYDVTLAWSQDEGLRAVSALFQRLSTAPAPQLPVVVPAPGVPTPSGPPNAFPSSPVEFPGLKSALRVAAPKLDAETWTSILSAAFDHFGISSHRVMAIAIGQFLVEAGAAFQARLEDLTYTHAERLVAIFPNELPNLEAAGPYVDNPEKLANLVYANRNGNVDVTSGDGFRFRGRGLIQVTGRNNYSALAQHLGQGIEAAATFAETPLGAAISGCWYLVERGCLALAQQWDVDGVTRVINPKMEAAGQREIYANGLLKALGG